MRWLAGLRMGQLLGVEELVELWRGLGWGLSGPLMLLVQLLVDIGSWLSWLGPGSWRGLGCWLRIYLLVHL